jgi:hypothetical protein
MNNFDRNAMGSGMMPKQRPINPAIPNQGGVVPPNQPAPRQTPQFNIPQQGGFVPPRNAFAPPMQRQAPPMQVPQQGGIAPEVDYHTQHPADHPMRQKFAEYMKSMQGKPNPYWNPPHG